jgi:hypothetical protein
MLNGKDKSLSLLYLRVERGVQVLDRLDGSTDLDPDDRTALTILRTFVSVKLEQEQDALAETLRSRLRLERFIREDR